MTGHLNALNMVEHGDGVEMCPFKMAALVGLGSTLNGSIFLVLFGPSYLIRTSCKLLRKKYRLKM